MTIPNPDHFFDQADKLIQSSPPKGAPRQVDLRRAISTAYYGVFHFILQRSADEFIGASPQFRASPLYTLAYRSIDHKTLRDICDDVNKSKLPVKLKDYEPPDGFDPSVKSFAMHVHELQEKRHEADYDPSKKFLASDVKLLIATARSAVDKFRNANKDHQRTFVALLLFKSR